MKINLNKSTKRALSLVLALAVLVGSLFTANIGVNINANAATETKGEIWYWDGGVNGETADTLADSNDGSGDGSSWEKAIIINNVYELAYICGKINPTVSKDKYYKIKDGVSAIVLQPSEYGEQIMGLSDASRVETFFEDIIDTSKRQNWCSLGSSGIFNGNFDGNGATVYGLYGQAATGSSSPYYCGLFMGVDGGDLGDFTDTKNDGSCSGSADSPGAVKVDYEGITIKNIAVKNSYMSAADNTNSNRTIGAIVAKCYTQGWGAHCDGKVNIENCIVANNYMRANQYSVSGTAYRPSASNGVVLGNAGTDIISINNCLVYGNDARNIAYNGETLVYEADFTLHGSVTNNRTDAEGNPIYNRITNSVVMGTAPYPKYTYQGNQAGGANCFENVYTDQPAGTVAMGNTWSAPSEFTSSVTFAANQVKQVSSDDAKGSYGKLYMDKLDWATNNQDGTWYAIEGEYPTIFRPDSWKDCESITPWTGGEADFTEGTGVEGDPYLIETPEQLWKMVKTGGTRETAFTYKNENGEDVTLAAGTPAYYKVKEGVKNLYLSKVISGGYDAIKSLAGGTDYHNWYTENHTAFVGNFDGNGVTVRGMISKSTTDNRGVGLVQWLGTNAVVKNVNFDTCYAEGTKSGAILASKVTALANDNNDGTTTGGAKNAHVLVYNIAVRNSYSKGTYAGGVISENTNIPDMLEIVNCVYDGYSCQLDGSSKAGIFSTVTWLNNLQIVGCVSLNAAVSAQQNATTWSEDQYAGWQVNSKLTYTDYGFEDETAFKETTMPYNDYRTGIDGARYVNHKTLSDGSYEPSRWYWNCHPVYVYNTYTDVKETYDTTAVELVDENGASTVSNLKDAQALMDAMPLLDWTNGYYVAYREDGTVLPMPRVRTADDIAATYQTEYVVLNYGELIGVTDGGAGSSPYNGRDGHFENLVGSGTEADPYIITTAKELARVVAAGGTKLNNNLYFKLANDIDLTGMPWISTVGFAATSGSSKVVYVPFAGTLDGDGHTITGLYAVNNDGAAGFIPELASTGVVKNLHIRDGHVGSSEEYTPYVKVTTTVTVDGETQSYGTGTALDRGNSVPNVNTAGAIAGITAEGAQIIGCSVENTTVVNTADGMTADGNATVKNSYIGETYYNADGAKVTADAIDLESGIWYKGGLEGSMPQLVNRAAAMSETDVSGLGDTDYNSADLSALRNKLLRKSAYNYIYGDVNRDGEINSTDLVILRRAMVDDYKDLQDGFWRNVEKNQIIVYYEENDTQDMARKLELYLEAEVPGVDILKYALKGGITDDSVTNTLDSRPTQNAIIVLKDTPTDDGYDDYSVTYDSANNVLTVNGGSFTAVEQAVIKFMQKADRATNNVGECTGSILDETLTDIKITNAENAEELLVSTETKSDPYSYKQRVKVGDTYYYYAWGDEFEGVSDTISSDNWAISKYRGETSDGSGSLYLNQENANLDDLKTLWVCNDGRLSIWRGVNTDVYNSGAYTGEKPTNGYEWGYKGISLGTSGTNDFGKELDANDVYIDPGLMSTNKSMLFKQGYIEMEASLPSDGYAFPAWWFYTYNGATSNNDISKSLYGKVFELNNDNNTHKWDGVTDKINASTGLTTYKYKIPTAYLEFDIVETMQTLYSGYNKTTGYVPSTSTRAVDTAYHYNRDFNLTVHKTYKSNVVNDQFYLIDWDNYSVSSPVTWDTFNSGWNSTSADHGWTHAYNNKKDGYGSYDIKVSLFNSETQYGAAYLGRNMTATVKYGFAWNVDVSNKTYNIDVYVSTDGTVDTESPVLHIDQTTGHQYQDTIWNNKSNKETADAELWNQYAYMILDNSFYTANSGSYTQFTELLKQNKSGGADNTSANYYINDKTTFDINYVRVYQQDGMRDIVTRDTEAFNNGDHFGYGK